MYSSTVTTFTDYTLKLFVSDLYLNTVQQNSSFHFIYPKRLYNCIALFILSF